MNKKTLLKLSFTLASALFASALCAENINAIKTDMSKIEQQQTQEPENRIAETKEDEDFSNSLANKINTKLDVLNKQVEEAQQIKQSSLNIPKSQLLDEKRIEQYLPVMSGSYTISKNNKTLENKALALDEKEQKYYLDTKNNDLVQNVNTDYLVYKNSETNKPFKSPLALPNKTSDDLKVSSTNTINSVTPLIQDLNKVPLPPLSNGVQQDLNKIK